MDRIDECIVANYPTGRPLLEVAYTQVIGDLLREIVNATGREITPEELWGRLTRLRDAGEIFAPPD